jgi:tRNA-guanine family transglycosylase
MHFNFNSPYFFYPNVLVSPFVTGFNKSSKDFGQSRPKLKVYADSGGYQVATQHKSVSALDVLGWQEKIADVGFTLDIPPYAYECNEKNYKVYTEHFFNIAMEKSIESANKMYEGRDESVKMELWAVLQGKNAEEIRRWYKEQTKHHEFVGYSIAITAAVNVMKETFSWLGQLEVAKEIDTNMHFLGRSEPMLALILAKLASITGHTYTYDTSSAIVGPRFGKYFDPYFHNLLWLSQDLEKRPNITTLPCDCPVCLKHTLDEVANTNYLITLHNVYCIKRFNEYANAIATDDEMFDYAINHFLNISRLYSARKEQVKNQIDYIIYGERLKVKSLSEFYD